MSEFIVKYMLTIKRCIFRFFQLWQNMDFQAVLIGRKGHDAR
jgi:hypothetical protein